MSHKVRQSFDELTMGARIVLVSDHNEVELIGKTQEGLLSMLRVSRNGHDRWVDYFQYHYTLINSPGFCEKYDESVENDAEDTWSECESYYGIDHLGDHTPCPLRQLAFRILRGDPMALDAARDALRC